MRGHLEKKERIELPRNLTEPLIKLYESKWWRHYDLKTGEKNCNWLNLALSDNLRENNYAFVYHPSKTNFIGSTTLRLPSEEEDYIIDEELYLPQDVTAVINEKDIGNILFQQVTSEIRELYFDVSKAKLDKTKKAIVQNSDYILHFPVIAGDGKIAEGLENILRDFLEEIREKGSMKFYNFYTSVKGNTRKKNRFKSPNYKPKKYYENKD